MLLELDKIISFYSFRKHSSLQLRYKNSIYEMTFDYVISQRYSFSLIEARHLQAYLLSYLYVRIFIGVRDRVDIIQRITVFIDKNKYVLEINPL